MQLTLAAYSASFGGVTASAIEGVLAVSVLCFGFATMLCWAHYGSEALGFLLGFCHNKEEGEAPSRKTSTLLYLLLFCGSSLAGAIFTPALVWALTDLVTEIMTLLNTSVLLLARRSICEETRIYFGVPLTRSRRP